VRPRTYLLHMNATRQNTTTVRTVPLSPGALALAEKIARRNLERLSATGAGARERAEACVRYARAAAAARGVLS
jgi:hypothetical protein